MGNLRATGYYVKMGLDKEDKGLLRLCGMAFCVVCVWRVWRVLLYLGIV